jgi:hypothetical protein
MGTTEAQAEYDKLKGLLGGLSTICESNKMPDEALAALRGSINADALSNLAANLRVKRFKVLSELAGITKAFGGR